MEDDLIVSPPTAPLGPGVPHLGLRPRLEAAMLELTPARRAGLWLAYNFFEESHAISQDLDSGEGSFWHAILHRREPDPANAKYWFRQVGAHPVLDRLAVQSLAIGYRYTTPSAFVDFCERVRATGSAEEALAQRVQMLEWKLLIDQV